MWSCDEYAWQWWAGADHGVAGGAEVGAEQWADKVLRLRESGTAEDVLEILQRHCEAYCIVGPGVVRATMMVRGDNDYMESATQCLVRVFRQAAMDGDMAVADMMSALVTTLPIVTLNAVPGGVAATPVPRNRLTRDALVAAYLASTKCGTNKYVTVG
jgi:hypothetical protein